MKDKKKLCWATIWCALLCVWTMSIAVFSYQRENYLCACIDCCSFGMVLSLFIDNLVELIKDK